MCVCVKERECRSVEVDSVWHWLSAVLGLEFKIPAQLTCKFNLAKLVHGCVFVCLRELSRPLCCIFAMLLKTRCINPTIPAFKLTSVFGCLLLCQPGWTERLFSFQQKDVLSCPDDSTENSQQPAQQLWMAQLNLLHWTERCVDQEKQFWRNKEK